MTLSEMADFICDKVNLTEPEDKASCKGFLRRRFEAIWNDQLWKDSLVDFTQTLASTGYTAASTWLPTRQVLLLPEIFDRVVAVRTGDRRLSVQSQEFYYRSDYDAFAQSGSVVEFFQLKPCVWELDGASSLYVTREAAADATLVLTLDAVLGAVSRRLKPTLDTTPKSLGSYERLDSLSKIASAGRFIISTSKTIRAVNGTYPAAPEHAYLRINTDPSTYVAGEQIYQPFMSDVQAAGIPPESAEIADAITMYWWHKALPSDIQTGPYTIPDGFRGVMHFTGSSPTPSATFDSDTLLVVDAARTNAVKRLRLRLVGIPNDGTVLRVLGKAKAPSFSEDSDEPVIQGIENCLLAFAQGDMLERERQYGKAQLCYQEGVALLDRLKAIEVVQAAHNKRIVPDDGYGNPYDLWGHPPLSF